MAGGLEIGKLVAASFLHRYWKTVGWMLKVYLTVAVVVLMGITSLGIFGFLTGAYQQSHTKVELIDVKQEALISKKEFLKVEIDQLNRVELNSYNVMVLPSGWYDINDNHKKQIDDFISMAFL
jgi:preprotein translocase subunit SecF